MQSVARSNKDRGVRNAFMKKMFVFLNFVCSVMAFTGCEIHFAGGKSYDVPWWFVLVIFVFVLLLTVFLIIADNPKKFWAYCPQCEKRFYVSKRVFRLASHSPDSFGFVYKCPCCGKKHICYKSYNQD